MKIPAPPRKSPTYFEQVPVAVVRKIAVPANPNAASPGRRKPAVRASRAKGEK